MLCSISHSIDTSSMVVMSTSLARRIAVASAFLNFVVAAVSVVGSVVAAVSV